MLMQKSSALADAHARADASEMTRSDRSRSTSSTDGNSCQHVAKLDGGGRLARSALRIEGANDLWSRVGRYRLGVSSPLS